MAEEEKEEKKIIIDEDWKAEAQREKKILAAEEKVEKEEKQEQSKTQGPLPEGNFAALISTLATQALFSLGLLQVKGQEKKEPNLNLAKYNIDMLETIQEKTKGNLTGEEADILEKTLGELRMGYVNVAG